MLLKLWYLRLGFVLSKIKIFPIFFNIWAYKIKDFINILTENIKIEINRNQVKKIFKYYRN